MRLCWAGSDSGEVLPPSALHDELAALVEAGLSPAEVLRIATVGAAAFLRAEGEFGRVMGCGRISSFCHAARWKTFPACGLQNELSSEGRSARP